MSQHILYYRGYKIIYDNGTYKIVELLKSFLSMTEAIKEVDRESKDEFFFNLKQLNAKTNQATIKQD